MEFQEENFCEMTGSLLTELAVYLIRSDKETKQTESTLFSNSLHYEEDKIDKATPADYEEVSSAALSAVQPAQLDAVVSNLEETVVKPEDLHEYAKTNDVTLYDAVLSTAWTISPPTYGGTTIHMREERKNEWYVYIWEGLPDLAIDTTQWTKSYSSTRLDTVTTYYLGDPYTATRSRSSDAYQLGSQGGRLLQPAGFYASAEEVADLEVRKQDALPYPTNAIPYSAISGAPAPPSGSVTNRYPLFVIDLNPGETRFWNHIELKATTNNYASSHDNMLYFMGTTTNGTNTDDVVFIHDWCRLFILSKRADSDIRKWVRIRNTGDLNGYAPLALAIIVDPSMFRRNQGSEWLYEDNEELIWSYVRIGIEDAETDQDGRPCWRPVMPVKWYWRLPKWADERETQVDSSNVTPYVPPWNE